MKLHGQPMTWQERAACADWAGLPWTTDTANVSRTDVQRMRAVCDHCRVLLECLAAVDDLDVVGGWWAGADRDPHVPSPAVVVAWEPVPRRRRADRGGAAARVVEQAALVIPPPDAA